MDEKQPAAGPPVHPSGASRFPGASRTVSRGITVAAVVVAAAAGATAIGVVAGVLTLFGWGVAIVVATLAVGVAAALRPRPANGWLLVPVLALAVPTVAVAISGARVMPQRGAVVEAPKQADQIPRDGYRAGLGDLLVDLRGLRVDDGDRVVVPAGSDLGRTVVALPPDRCFNLDVRWKTGNLRLPRVQEQPRVMGFHPRNKLSLLGQQGPYHRKRYGQTHGRIALFGRAYDVDEGRWVARTDDADAPTLELELSSEGGSFVVRDYPDHAAPLRSTAWPIDQAPPPYPRPLRAEQALWAHLDAQRRTVEKAVAAKRATPPRPTVVPRTTSATPRPAERSSTAAKRPPASLRDELAAMRERDRQRNLRAAGKRQARLFQRSAKRRHAFARRWAQRVVSSCNPRGSFQ